MEYILYISRFLYRCLLYTSSCYGKNPKRTVYRNDHRDQNTGNKESFLNFLLLPLSDDELNTPVSYTHLATYQTHR